MNLNKKLLNKQGSIHRDTYFQCLVLVVHHSVSVTPKMVKKVITNLDSSKVAGPDCIPVVVLKSCESERTRELSVWKSLIFQIVGRSLWWSLSLRIGERSTGKNYCPVSLLFVVSKVFEKFVNNKIVDLLEKCVIQIFFLIFSMVLGLLDQLQFFWQFYLIELLGLSTGLELL